MILGGGESGVGTAILGKQKGFEVFLSDKNEIKLDYKKVLLHNEISFEECVHSESEILKADLVMKSPGIPDNIQLVKKLNEKSIPVISEIEFAAKYTDAKIIAITGSNGKTTTSLLTQHILKETRINSGLAGNIGFSFAQQVAQTNRDCYVLEVSSFQLDGIRDFKPYIAILTNLSPDHLDRYNYNFDEYIKSKFRIIKNQEESDYFIYDADDKEINKGIETYNVKSKLVPFSINKELDYGAYIKDKKIIIKINKETYSMPISSLSLKGKHNAKNAMAASLAAQLLKVRKNTIKESLSSFEGVEHRLEKVAKVKGVEYINDSKATNVNATFYALECMDKSTVWILGGVDKGNDYSDLLPLVREKVKAIVCLGLDNSKIKDAFENVVDVLVETAGAEEAVKVAEKISEKGDVVLLSPACASFDLFENYEERGRQFKKAVRNL